MARPRLIALSDQALLARYAQTELGAYTDCFEIEVGGDIALESLVEAFYSSRAFWLERVMIGLLFGRPATDRDARALAQGRAEAISAWAVEARAPGQILMRETISDKTRLWLMASPAPAGAAPATRLCFGTAMLGAGKRRWADLPAPVAGLLGAGHQAYARLLLASAAAKIARNGG